VSSFFCVFCDDEHQNRTENSVLYGSIRFGNQIFLTCCKSFKRWRWCSKKYKNLAWKYHTHTSL